MRWGKEGYSMLDDSEQEDVGVDANAAAPSASTGGKDREDEIINLLGRVGMLQTQLATRSNEHSRMEAGYKKRVALLETRLFKAKNETFEAMTVQQSASYQLSAVLRDTSQLQNTLTHLSQSTAQLAVTLSSLALSPTLNAAAKRSKSPQISIADLALSLEKTSMRASAAASAAAAISESMGVVSTLQANALRACESDLGRSGSPAMDFESLSVALSELSTEIAARRSLAQEQANESFQALVLDVTDLQKKQEKAASKLMKLQQEADTARHQIVAARSALHSTLNLQYLSELLDQSFAVADFQSQGIVEYLQTVELFDKNSPPQLTPSAPWPRLRLVQDSPSLSTPLPGFAPERGVAAQEAQPWSARATDDPSPAADGPTSTPDTDTASAPARSFVSEDLATRVQRALDNHYGHEPGGTDDQDQIPSGPQFPASGDSQSDSDHSSESMNYASESYSPRHFQPRTDMDYYNDNQGLAAAAAAAMGMDIDSDEDRVNQSPADRVSPNPGDRFNQSPAAATAAARGMDTESDGGADGVNQSSADRASPTAGDRFNQSPAAAAAAARGMDSESDGGADGVKLSPADRASPSPGDKFNQSPAAVAAAVRGMDTKSDGGADRVNQSPTDRAIPSPGDKFNQTSAATSAVARGMDLDSDKGSDGVNQSPADRFNPSPGVIAHQTPAGAAAAAAALQSGLNSDGDPSIDSFTALASATSPGTMPKRSLLETDLQSEDDTSAGYPKSAKNSPGPIGESTTRSTHFPQLPQEESGTESESDAEEPGLIPLRSREYGGMGDYALSVASSSPPQSDLAGTSEVFSPASDRGLGQPRPGSSQGSSGGYAQDGTAVGLGDSLLSSVDDELPGSRGDLDHMLGDSNQSSSGRSSPLEEPIGTSFDQSGFSVDSRPATMFIVDPLDEDSLIMNSFGGDEGSARASSSHVGQQSLSHSPYGRGNGGSSFASPPHVGGQSVPHSPYSPSPAGHQSAPHSPYSSQGIDHTLVGALPYTDDAEDVSMSAEYSRDIDVTINADRTSASGSSSDADNVVLTHTGHAISQASDAEPGTPPAKAAASPTPPHATAYMQQPGTPEPPLVVPKSTGKKSKQYDNPMYSSEFQEAEEVAQGSAVRMSPMSNTPNGPTQAKEYSSPAQALSVPRAEGGPVASPASLAASEAQVQLALVENEKLKAELQAVMGELAALSAVKQQNDSLNAELANVSAELTHVAELQRELEILQSQNEALQLEVDEASAMREEVASLQREVAEVNRLKEENDEPRVQVAT
eukprot:gene29671-5086_t